jgi:hypothetical protein
MIAKYAMKCSFSVWASGAICIVVALALASQVNLRRTVHFRNRFYQDPWMTYTVGIGPERFQEVIAMVPPTAVVGYVSDLPVIQGMTTGTPADYRGAVWFATTRTALAPRLLVPYHEGQEGWIVGNFSKPIDPDQLERQFKLRLVRDFGSGVVLFRNVR